jgi:hypothetical protein
MELIRRGVIPRVIAAKMEMETSTSISEKPELRLMNDSLI